MTLVAMLTEESGGCLSLLLEWRTWVALLALWAVAITAWDLLKAIATPTPRKIQFRVRVRRGVRKTRGEGDHPKDGGEQV